MDRCCCRWDGCEVVACDNAGCTKTFHECHGVAWRDDDERHFCSTKCAVDHESALADAAMDARVAS